MVTHKKLWRAERCPSICSNSSINPSPVLGHLVIHPVQSILRRKMKKGYVQSRTTYSSTTRPPADNPDQIVPFRQRVLHSERSSAIPTTGALACGPGTNHVARDLVFECPIGHSDTSPWGGLVVGRGARRCFTDGVRHYGHLDLLQNHRYIWITRVSSLTPT